MSDSLGPEQVFFGPSDNASAGPYFVPVCLYPHTKYRTYAGVGDLLSKFDFMNNQYLIVVADRLAGIDNLVTGRYVFEKSVFLKARREAEPIMRLLTRILRKQAMQGNGKVVYWDDIARTEEFTVFEPIMQDLICSDTLLHAALNEFVNRRVGRFGLGSDRAREWGFEQDYLLSEICMSVFCTEVLGFKVEIWERPPPTDTPDLLKLLYDARSGLVARATGRPPSRILKYLYPSIDGGQ